MINNFLCPPGGPLCEGDIEDADGVLQVFCPWHDYDFDLRTGKSGTSLQVSVEICHSSMNYAVLSAKHLLSVHISVLKRPPKSFPQKMPNVSFKCVQL